MRTKFIIIFGLLVGCALGVVPTYARFGWVWSAPKFRWDQGDVVINPGQPTPQAFVVEKEADLGLVERDGHADHAFIFQNTGDAPLTLTALGVQCHKCTEILPIERSTVPPGESGSVVVRYRAVVDGDFNKAAYIGTNDPRHFSVTLTVKGKTVSSYEFKPAQLFFAGVSTHEARKDSVRLISYLLDHLEISKWEITDPTLASQFDVTWSPINPSELAGDKAKSGVRIEVSTKPGLPQGILPPLGLRLTTNLQPNPIVELLIEGTVVGDVAFIGKAFRADPDRLELGFLDSQEDNVATVQLLARGDNNAQVKYEVTLAEPSFLHAEIGPSKGKLTPLKLTIPKGTPICNYLGGGENPVGHVELKTSHPFAPRIRLPVTFAISK